MEIKKDMTTKGHLCLWTTSWTRGKVQFSSVVSDSLQPHGLQHARPPCPSPTPRAYSNACPWSWWCHPTISSSIVPFSSHLQSFPASKSFPISQFFASGGQSIGVSGPLAKWRFSDFLLKIDIHVDSLGTLALESKGTETCLHSHPSPWKVLSEKIAYILSSLKG